MAKVNVNKATREDLVDVAGLRAPVAEAIVKARDESGNFADMDALRTALKDAKGVTANALDQLEGSLEFGAEQAKEMASKAADVAKAGADTTRKMAEKTAEVTMIATRTGAEAATKVAQRAAAIEKESVARSAETAKDLSELVVSVMTEQMQANVEAMQALAKVKSWREAVEINTTYMRGNVERMSSTTSRYIEAMTRLMGSMSRLGRDELNKAA